MKLKLTALVILLAAPAISQEFPAHYATRGVADNDTLNIRAEPDATSEIIGEYGPYTLNIEVLRTTPDGKWGFVGVGERNGWASMQYLEASNHVGPNEFPRPMTCSGTEPFWRLGVTPRGGEYQIMGEDLRLLNMMSESVATEGYMAVFEEGPTLNRTLIVKRGTCGDGMSDREFGFSAMLFNEAPDGNSVQTGCCTLDAN